LFFKMPLFRALEIWRYESIWIEAVCIYTLSGVVLPMGPGV
jgi:hypothetical protein